MPRNSHSSSLVYIIVPYETLPSGTVNLGAILSSESDLEAASENGMDLTKLADQPMPVAAIMKIEIANAFIQDQSLEQLLSVASLRDTPFEQSVASLVQKLTTIPEDSYDGETEELAFHIFELPPDTPNIKPGTYVEVSHGDTIADNIAWWQETSEGLPGTIFGYISIEVYKEMLLPEATEIIEKCYCGEPEDLETLIGDSIARIFRHLAGR